MKHSIVFLFLALIGISLAYHNKDWKLEHKADGTELHTVIFALKSNEGAKEMGDSILSQIHDPSSPQYQQFLSGDQVAQMFVNSAAVAKVENYLASHQIEYTTKGGWVYGTASAAVWDNLLNCNLHHHSHHNHQNTILRSTTHYTIPSEISDEVHMLIQVSEHPVAHKGLPTDKKRHLKRDEADPTVLRSTYNVPNAAPSSPTTITMSILSNSAIILSDVDTFETQFNTAARGKFFIYDASYFNESECYDIDCGEPTLDTQYMIAMAPGVDFIFFNNPPGGDGIAIMFNWMATNDSAADIASISLGVGPDQQYDEMMCNVVQQVVLRGRTIFVASGDGGPFDDNCNLNDGFPCSCPYITCVGGTQGPENGDAEVEWIGSGAGVSSFFPVPDWEANISIPWFEAHPNQYITRTTNRAFPDVSAESADLPLVFRGETIYAAGTSFGSPIFAGIYTQIAVRRQIAGYPQIGYLNLALATLYNQGKNALTDITSGYTEGSQCPGYVEATPGWDFGTGFGSPHFDRMVEYLVPYASSTGTSTQAPTTQPPTSKPPTAQPPTTAPIAGCGLTIQQSMASSWQNADTTITQFDVVLTNTGSQTSQASFRFSATPQSIFSVSGPVADGTYSLPDWYSSGLPAGASLTFGYTTTGSLPLIITLTAPSSCVSGSTPTNTPSAAPTSGPAPTNTPTNAPSSAPTPTNAPSAAPTAQPPTAQPPTTAPISGCGLSIQQSVSSSWQEAGTTKTQFNVVLTNTGSQASQASFHLSVVPSSIWSVSGPAADGTYGLPDWYNSGLPAGSSLSFGYITTGSAPLVFTFTAPSSCVSGSTPTNAPSYAPTNAPTNAPSSGPTPTNAPPVNTPTNAPTSGPVGGQCSSVTFSDVITSSWTDATGPVTQYQVTIVNSGAHSISSLQISAGSLQSNIINFWVVEASGTNYALPSYSLPLAPSSTVTFGYIIAHTNDAATFTVASMAC